MEKEIRFPKLKRRVDSASPARVSLQMSKTDNVDGPDEVVQPIPRHRRRTTSFKAKRPCDQRRPSLPLFNKYNAKPKTIKKTVFQRIGTRLAKVGDDLLKKRGKFNKGNPETRQSMRPNLDKKSCLRRQQKDHVIADYAAQLAALGDYLESLYSNDVSPMYSENRYATLGANCALLTTILFALRNDNVVVIRESDLETLSTFCRIHRVKSMSRKDR